MLDKSDTAIDKIRGRLGHVAEHKEGREVFFYLPEWIPAYSQYFAGILNEDNEPETEESGWLEEKRKWDAKRSQTAYLKEHGQLISVSDANRNAETILGHIRRSVEQLCPNCRDRHDEAVASAFDELSELYPGDSDSDNLLGSDDGDQG